MHGGMERPLEGKYPMLKHSLCMCSIRSQKWESPDERRHEQAAAAAEAGRDNQRSRTAAAAGLELLMTAEEPFLPPPQDISKEKIFLPMQWLLFNLKHICDLLGIFLPSPRPRCMAVFRSYTQIVLTVWQNAHIRKKNWQLKDNSAKTNSSKNRHAHCARCWFFVAIKALFPSDAWIQVLTFSLLILISATHNQILVRVV